MEGQKMRRKNKTIDRLQAIWNMIGGDDVVDALIKGRATLQVRWIVVKWIRTIRTSATTELFEVKKSFKTGSTEINLKDDGFTGIFKSGFLLVVARLKSLVGRK